MEFKKALQVMQHYVTEDERRPMKLAIAVTGYGSVGGTACVDVETMGAGIDWDRGKMMIHPAKPLTTLTADEVADIRKSVAKGQSWHAYQDYKKQQEQLKAVEAQRDELLAALKAMAEEFRGHDLPYGSKAYEAANTLINKLDGNAAPEPRYTSVSKGGSYTKLGAIRGAGSLKGLAGIAYQNEKGDLFIREPECFAKRMVLVEQGGAS